MTDCADAVETNEQNKLYHLSSQSKSKRAANFMAHAIFELHKLYELFYVIQLLLYCNSYTWGTR
jgi:hypothetical protein